MLIAAVCGMRRFWARFANHQGAPQQREVQLLAVPGKNPASQRSGAANGFSHHDAEAQADAQLLNGAKPGAPGRVVPELDQQAAAPVRGMQQEKLPLSDDPFWDQE